MKASRFNGLTRLGQWAIVLALFMGMAGGLEAQARGLGAQKLMELSNRFPKPAPAKSDFQPMPCTKCTDRMVESKDNEPAKGAGARALMAGGAPVKWVSKHDCEGCGVDWKVTGQGRAKAGVALHKCTSCGVEDMACCATKKGSLLATRGMEKKIEVAPLK